jgi:hypothetical protein
MEVCKHCGGQSTISTTRFIGLISMNTVICSQCGRPWEPVEEKMYQLIAEAEDRKKHDPVLSALDELEDTYKLDPNLVIETIDYLRAERIKELEEKDEEEENKHDINWISVKDELPEQSQEVLVCNINGIDQDERDPFIAVLNCKKFFWINRYNYDDWKEEIVTHWMPLPEGPEKELEE